MKKTVKILMICVLSVLAFVGVLLGSLQLSRVVKYHDFLSIRKRILPNPGLNSGAIPQGLTYNADDDVFATSTNAKKGCGRIYTVSSDGKKIHRYDVLSGGEPYMEHIGGLQYLDGKYFVAVEGVGVYCFDAAMLDGVSDTVEIGEVKIVNNHSSFIWSDGVNLLVGEFNNDAKYACTNFIQNGDMENHAIATVYSPYDLKVPLIIYSIPNLVQGMCITDGNKVVLSTSWATKPSQFLIYDESDVELLGVREYEGVSVPVVFLGKPTKILNAPSMSEDLDLYDGKVIYHSEAASNKYVFGKFFFDYGIYALDIDGLEDLKSE